jgi:uncharacterized SAM-binding protein YcdF (DUF218 family)
MFFTSSKIFEFLLAPLNLSIFLVLTGALLLYTSFSNLGRRLSLIGGAMLTLMAFGSLGGLIAMPLETRFLPPAENIPAPDGIIILGGSIDEKLSEKIGRPVFIDSAAERLTALITLKRLYPSARIIFTGGSSALKGANYTEADGVKLFWNNLGVDTKDIVFENRSRNTFENALFTYEIIKPKPTDRWLLVTSAMHMPRAIGVFRKIGFPVIAYPVDYRTEGKLLFFSPPRFATRAIGVVQFATHEWIGLIIYWLTGKTNALFPAP